MQGQVFVPEDLQNDWEVLEPSATNGDKVAVNGISEPQEEVTKRLAAFVHEILSQNLGPVEIQRTRQYLLDFLGVTVLGAERAESSAFFVKSVEALAAGSQGAFRVLGTSKRLPQQYAALLNGTFAHSLDFDDTFPPGVLHIASSVIPAALAEAEVYPELQLSELLLAIAVGYEVTGRIATACGTSSWSRGFHNTGICGIFGAVAAISKLRKLDARSYSSARRPFEYLVSLIVIRVVP